MTRLEEEVLETLKYDILENIKRDSEIPYVDKFMIQDYLSFEENLKELIKSVAENAYSDGQDNAYIARF